MQQHLMQMQPMMASYYPNTVTSDHIQQYLDENKSLILTIVESQKSGKLSECVENQARLQRNLMYLAAIADSQPQPPSAMHPQYSTSGIMQGGGHYMQHQQAQQMTPQALMATRSSMVYNQQLFSALQQHQALHGHGSGRNPNLMLQTETNIGANSTLGAQAFADFGRSAPSESMHRAVAGGGSKLDIGSSGSADGRVGSSGGHCGNGEETRYLKSVDDGN